LQGHWTPRPDRPDEHTKGERKARKEPARERTAEEIRPPPPRGPGITLKEKFGASFTCGNNGREKIHKNDTRANLPPAKCLIKENGEKEGAAGKR